MLLRFLMESGTLLYFFRYAKRIALSAILVLVILIGLQVDFVNSYEYKMAKEMLAGNIDIINRVGHINNINFDWFNDAEIKSDIVDIPFKIAAQKGNFHARIILKERGKGWKICLLKIDESIIYIDSELGCNDKINYVNM